MLNVKTVNGKEVAKEFSEETVEAGTEFLDIASSGEVGALLDDRWRVEELKELFDGLTAEVKLELFVWAVGDMDSEGWHVSDIKTLIGLCGVEKCEIEF